MKIHIIKWHWKNIITAIRHHFSYYTKDEIMERKGEDTDIVNNINKIWQENLTPCRINTSHHLPKIND